MGFPTQPPGPGLGTSQLSCRGGPSPSEQPHGEAGDGGTGPGLPWGSSAGRGQEREGTHPHWGGGQSGAASPARDPPLWGKRGKGAEGAECLSSQRCPRIRRALPNTQTAVAFFWGPIGASQISLFTSSACFRHLPSVPAPFPGVQGSQSPHKHFHLGHLQGLGGSRESRGSWKRLRGLVTLGQSPGPSEWAA